MSSTVSVNVWIAGGFCKWQVVTCADGWKMSIKFLLFVTLITSGINLFCFLFCYWCYFNWQVVILEDEMALKLNFLPLCFCFKRFFRVTGGNLGGYHDIHSSTIVFHFRSFMRWYVAILLLIINLVIL